MVILCIQKNHSKNHIYAVGVIMEDECKTSVMKQNNGVHMVLLLLNDCEMNINRESVFRSERLAVALSYSA